MSMSAAALLVWPVMLALGVWLASKGRTDEERMLRFASPSALWALVIVVLGAAWYSPNVWNLQRILPPLAFLEGHPLYPAIGDGPLYCSTPYPPMTFFSYLPVALAPRDPISIALVGTLISVTFSFGAAGLIFKLAGHAGAVWKWAAFGTFVLISLNNRSLAYGMSYIHSDAPAIGYSLLACACLAFLPAKASFGRILAAFAAAAVFTALAAWTRQVLLILPLPLALMVWRRLGWRFAILFAAIATVVHGAALGIFVAMFGGENLYTHLVKIPFTRPWWFDDRKKVMLMSIRDWTRYALVPVGVTIFGWGVSICADRQSGRTDSSRKDTQSGAAMWFLAVGVVLFPIAIWTRCSLLADINHFALSLAFILISGLLKALESAVVEEPSPKNSRVFLAIMVAVSALMVLPKAAELDSKWNYFSNHPVRQAFDYDWNHPGEAYFPWMPIVPFLNHGRLDHFILAVHDRELGGYPVSPTEFELGVPATAKWWAINRESSRPLTHMKPGSSGERYQNHVSQPKTKVVDLDQFLTYTAPEIHSQK